MIIIGGLLSSLLFSEGFVNSLLMLNTYLSKVSCVIIIIIEVNLAMQKSAEELQNMSGSKKIKISNREGEDEWIVVKKKQTPLTITISDHSKVNRFYGHKSIQKYIRYLLTETCPNPMWLAIKRQSQIEHIYYFDIEIEDYLFEKLLAGPDQRVGFLSSKISFESKAVFRQGKMNRYVWDSLLVYEEEVEKCDQKFEAFENSTRPAISKQVYEEYLQYILTPEELKQNLYPDRKYPLFKNYLSVAEEEISGNSAPQLQEYHKNLILVCDCEMVSTAQGLQLARCTIMNYEEEVIFDELFKPLNPILNYNTEYSGITEDLLKATNSTIEGVLYPFLKSHITEDTILVGHSLENDFNAMKFSHPKVLDTSVLYQRKNGTKMKLKSLSNKLLKRQIQSLTHDSKEDCLATLHLVQMKIENKEALDANKQYHLLRDLTKFNHSALFVDHQIDDLRKYTGFHFEKIQPQERPSKVCDVIAKYSRSAEVKTPKIVFSRIEKSQDYEWEDYYEELSSSLQKLYSIVPSGSVYFLHFQINQNVRITPFTKEEAKTARTRPFLAVLPKN